ncbi:MAG: protein-glutamate O-methyltransferase CheR [Desulfobacterales bacterium]|nr:protein-glutamate O-methyltransferase CheR [Desulfobacterales bacterium]
MSIASNEQESFQVLKNLIQKNLGFNCEQYKEAHFKRRIDVRMRSTSSKDYAGYIKHLNSNPAEYTSLIDTLTVNVTDFFRNPETYEHVEKEVLPAVIRAKAKTPIKSIRIWSAGSSIGVEAYSIAIMLHKLLKQDFKRYKISIIGTDIDKASLFKAQLGVYSETEMKGVDSKTAEKYFVKKGDKYHVIDDLKKITTFKRNDLISGTKMTGFDVIFCRNVTIYFTKELQEKLYMIFYDSLNNGGYYVMGKTETMIGPAKDAFNPFCTKERIYTK